jgi:response regulator RpfG family c-di-GMP phosphodiesterase
MDTAPTTILCVDDEVLFRTILRDFLQPHGYRVLEAATGREALQILEDQDIDVVLLDVNMPEMDGLEACRYIKADEHTAHIPVIMITSLAGTDDRIRGIEAGAEDYIFKPFHQEEVLARIRMLLKVKNLNEKLRNAYDSIKDLTAFGESIIQNFKPTSFDLHFSIDNIVSKLLYTGSGGSSKPAVIVFGVEEGGECNFYRYNLAGGRLLKEPMELMQGSCSPSSVNGNDSPVYFFNGDELHGSPFHGMVEVLAESGTPVENMVTYVSESLTLYALNYQSEVTAYEAAVLESLVMQVLFLKSLSEQVAETEDAFTYTIYCLARAAEIRDADTADHILRVGEYCSTIASRLKLPDHFVREIRVQSALHDIGKIHTPLSILQKPGRLDKDEWEEMKLHTVYGGRIIGDHRHFKLGKSIALTHHENWDGSGYPKALSGNRIPVEGRIMALADTYDALRTQRVYKAGFDHETAYQIILEGDDRTLPTHFDPKVLYIFKDMAGKFEEIFEETREV